MDLSQKIEEFKNKFKNDKFYEGNLFFEWHGILTGSCRQGRETFYKEEELDLKNQYSVKDFLSAVKNNYGWEQIQELEKYYEGE